MNCKVYPNKWSKMIGQSPHDSWMASGLRLDDQKPAYISSPSTSLLEIPCSILDIQVRSRGDAEGAEPSISELVVTNTSAATCRLAHPNKSNCGGGASFLSFSSSWRVLGWWRTLPSGVSSDSSRLLRISLARSNTGLGTPARRATWMP